MRKAAVLAVGLVIGGLVGAIGWQVGWAVPPQIDTLEVCERAGADLRSPAANGTCPSGYTKKTITETAPDSDPIFQASSVAPVTAQQILDSGQGTVAVASVTLPPGAYSIVASGTVFDEEQTVRNTCDLRIGPTTLDEVHINGGHSGYLDSEWTLSGAVEITGNIASPVKVFCGVASGDPDGDSTYEWTITATQGDSLNPLI